MSTAAPGAAPAIATGPASWRNVSAKDVAVVEIALEGADSPSVVKPDGPSTPAEQQETIAVKARKEKKKVAFQSDRPELYDF
jgi:hypothetical protein